MANLIRLKQIESGSTLETAATIAQDFSGSVYEVIDGAGLISSSAQVDLLSASNYDGFVAQLDITMSSDIEVSIISASISQSLFTLYEQINSNTNIEAISASLDLRIGALEYFSSSLGDSFATDVELYQTSSQIIDQGEW